MLCAAVPWLIWCGSPVNPSEGADLAVAGGESLRVVYLNAETGSITGTAPFTVGPTAASAFDQARQVGYFTANGAAGRELLALNFSTNTIEWRAPMAAVGYPVFYNGVQLFGAPMALLPGNASLIMLAVRHDSVGIATFDLGTRTLGAFRGPLKAGFIALPASGNVAAVLQTGKRPDGRISTSVLILDPGDLRTLDSIAPAPPYEDPSLPIEVPGGDRLLMSNYTHIYLYSRQQRTVLASVQRPALGAMAFSPNGQLIVLGDFGTFPDDPGSGKLYVYNASLQLQQVIDLAPVSLDGNRVVTTQMAFSRDGRWLFVAAGTSSRGPLYGPQPAQVVVIDATTLQVLRAIPLNDWGSVQLFPLR